MRLFYTAFTAPLLSHYVLNGILYMSKALNIAIVGAGLAGRLLAYQLSERNFCVHLYEANQLTLDDKPQHLSAAAFTAAGMIAPISEAIEADLETYWLGKTSLKLWPAIIAKLNLNSEQPVQYQHSGSLIISHPQDLAELQQFKARVQALPAACNAQFKSLNAQQISQLEPDLSNHFHSGLLLEDEAHIDNRQLMKVLLQRCLANGVELIDNAPVSIAGNSVMRRHSKQYFDWVIDCRGTGAKPQISQLRGVRGEVLRVQTKEITLQRPIRLMHPRYQLYLVPKPNHHFVIGATQIESEDRSPMSVQSMLELCSAMYSINPAFSQARIIEQNTNLRPALNDNKAKVIVDKQQLSINGLFRHGFLIAPAIIDSVINWLEGKDNPHQQHLFSFSESLNA